MIQILLLVMLGCCALAQGKALTVDEAVNQGQWNVVESLLMDRQDTVGLLLRGEARRAMGYMSTALADHEQAWRQAETIKLKNWAARASAETLLAASRYPDATARLNTIRVGNDKTEQAQVALLRGNLETAQDHDDLARIAYEQALAIADQAGLTTISVQAQLALFKLDSGSPQELEEIASTAAQVTPLYIRIDLLLDMADLACQSNSLDLAEKLLNQVAPQATVARQRAELLALRATLLEATGHLNEAMEPISEAIDIAQRIEADDILLREEWQRGRLYLATGDQERSLSAFRRAVYHLQSIRQDIPIAYHAGHSSFRETLSPLYLGLTDVLLRLAAKRSEDAAQPLLLEARDVIEQLKAAELQDYLGEVCQIELKPIANLEAISPLTAVLYPILLADRLELLLGIGNRQYQATIPIHADAIRKASEALAAQLRVEPADGVMWNQPQAIANQLFNWLIAPIKSRLTAGGVKTLVIVPDGPLRLFPFSALMDGDTFLVERYAIVTAPSLTLMEPQPLARGKIQALVAGMSVPGPVVDEFASQFLASISKESTRGGFQVGKTRGFNLRALDVSTGPVKIMDPKVRAKLVEGLSLPGVEREVKAVSTELGSTPLLNQDFSLSSFGKAMQNQWRIVHVATHGYFGDTPDRSFFMTYDHLLKMDKLESIIEGNEGDPPELLTLSACQTAQGNDRAPLGLTGIAFKSGARSAIGSLWPVSDDATQIMITEFYHRLIDPHQTKAQAFQQAQLSVLHRQEFRHPFFWSPFILIGNWL